MLAKGNIQILFCVARTITSYSVKSGRYGSNLLMQSKSPVTAIIALHNLAAKMFLLKSLIDVMSKYILYGRIVN